MWTLLLAGAWAGPEIEPPGLGIVSQPPTTYKYAHGDPPGRCLVRVELDGAGVPTATEGKGCIERYAAAAESAVMGWRWKGVGTDATTHVPVSFTPKGTAQIGAAGVCAYTVRVASNGVVSVDPKGPRAQCQLWPMSRLSAPLMATGTCTATVPFDIARVADGWATFTDCSEAAAEATTELMRGSLFTFGTESTRFTVDYPDGSGPPPAAGAVDIGAAPGADEVPTRLSEAEGAEDDHRSLEVPEHEVPEVEFPIFPDMDDLGGDDDDDEDDSEE